MNEFGYIEPYGGLISNGMRSILSFECSQLGWWNCVWKGALWEPYFPNLSLACFLSRSKIVFPSSVDKLGRK